MGWAASAGSEQLRELWQSSRGEGVMNMDMIMRAILGYRSGKMHLQLSDLAELAELAALTENVDKESIYEYYCEQLRE